MSESKNFGNILGNIGEFSSRNYTMIFGLVAVLLAVSAVGVSMVNMSMGMDLYIDDGSEVNQHWQEIQSDFGKGNEVFLKIDIGDESIYDPEVMGYMDEIGQELYDTGLFTFVTTPSHPVKSGPGQGELLDTREEIIHSVYATRNNHRTANEMIQSLIPDNSTGIIVAQYGNIDVPEERDRFMGFMPGTEEEIVREEVENVLYEVDHPEYFDITVTGSPVFEDTAFGMMLPEMVELFGLALLVIVFVVFFVMKGKVDKLGHISLPFLTTVATLFVMMGFMGFVGFDFNAIMLGVMPIALGLGIDYGLQIQTRFLEERSKGKDVLEASKISTSNTGKALAFAMGTTLIGLGSLMISDVPPVRQFGATAGFSILVGMILSVTFLVSLLTVFDGKKAFKDSSDGKGMIEDIMCGLSEKVCGKRFFVIGAALILLAFGAFAYPQVDTTQEMLDYWPDIQERQDLRNLEDLVDSPNMMHVIVEDEGSPYNPESMQAISDMENRLEEVKHVNTVVSPGRAIEMGGEEIPDDQQRLNELLDQERQVDRPPVLGREIEEYGDRLLIQLFVEDIDGQPVRDVIDEVYSIADEELEDMDVRVTGKPVLNRNVIENVTAGLTEMTLLSFGLVFVFLGIVLKSAKYSAMLLGSVSVSAVLLVSGAMYLFGIPWNPLTVTVASIILGVGVDYGVHVYERFLEEKDEEPSLKEAVKSAVAMKSRPILGSGLTTMFGFGVLMISDFPVLANFGRAIFLAMLFSLLATFFILPSVLLLAGEK